MIPRPKMRMPLWVALALVLAAFAVRSVARGFDFTPDFPGDVIVLLALLIVLAVVGWVRADDARRDQTDQAAKQEKDPES